MMDRTVLAAVKPVLDRLAGWLVRRGLSADAVTVVGFALGLVAAVLVVAGEPSLALLPLLLSRLCDGLDGAMARQTQPTDRGAFLDITLDFLFYASMPLAFAIANPLQHALPAAVLLASFMGTGASFLAFAVMAERRGLGTALPNKGFYFLGGLTEGTETMLCFALMCLWPALFPWWAYGFAVLCAVTIITRLAAGWRLLSTTGA